MENNNNHITTSSNKYNGVSVKQKLLDPIRTYLRVNHYSRKTDKAYISWIKRHPSLLCKDDIQKFINHLVVEKYKSSSTQNQALQAILFLYKKVLEKYFGWLDEIKHAVRIKHISGLLKPIKYNHLLNRGLSVKSPLD